MRLVEAVAFALTGVVLEAPDEVRAQGAAVVSWLAAEGWTPGRLAEERHRCQEQRRPWPHPLPGRPDADWGYAQFHALVAEVRRATGTSGLMRSVRHGTPGPGDERFLRERPPHHGSV